MHRTLPLIALLFAVAAHAGNDPTAAKSSRPAVDANGDGVVTREEAKSHPRLAQQFDAADANKDGQLDATELGAHREAMRKEMREHAQQRWQSADADGDGALSRAEAQASMPGMAERFETFDANRDDRITRDEMHNFRMRKKQRAAGSE